jgi:hypothetical protein
VRSIYLAAVKIYKMKNVIIVLTLWLGVCQFSKAQSTQSVYFELGGPGIASLNYDMRFKGSDGLGARLGFGGIGADGESILYFPVGFNYLLGEGGRHYFEIGAGYTPVFGTNDGDSVLADSFGHLLFGYRLQPSAGGFSFRAFLCPVFGNGYFVPYYAGLSLGYAF